MPFPAAAQASESALAKLRQDRWVHDSFLRYEVGEASAFNDPTHLPLTITETFLLKFADDFGLAPDLISKRALAGIFRDVVKASGGIPPVAKASSAKASPRRGAGAPRRGAVVWGTGGKQRANKSPAKAVKNVGVAKKAAESIGFSQFCEVLVRASNFAYGDGYDNVLQSPLSRVMVVLCQWGVASPERLEEVKVVHGSHRVGEGEGEDVAGGWH